MTVDMSRLTRTLIPLAQRQPVAALHDAVDLGYGDPVAKRTGFLIMPVLSAIIATSGVLADSTATTGGEAISRGALFLEVNASEHGCGDLRADRPRCPLDLRLGGASGPECPPNG